MANVIDSLFITLGMDIKDYKKGQSEVAGAQKKLREDSAKTTKEMSEGNKKLVEGLTSLKVGLLEVVAIAAAGLGFKDFISDSMNGQAALGRMSKNLNMNARDLESWGVVAKEMGGNAQDAFSALQSVAGGMAEAAIKGHSAFTDTARANGVALMDNAGHLLNNEEALISISRRMQQMPRQQAMWLAGQLGLGGMSNELMLGPEELRKRLDAAAKLAKVTDASTQSAERLQKRWADLQERFKGVSDLVWAKLEPVLERLGYRLANWLDRVDWDKVVQKISDFADGVVSVVKAFGGWTTVAIVLGGILGLKVLSPVLGLIGGLARLVPLIASTTAGLWGLAAAGSAIAGGAIGHMIYKAMENTGAGRGAGHFVAQIMGGLGSDEALQAQAYNIIHQGALDDLTNPTPIHRRGLPRGIRNNNPGNLNFAGQPGAHLESPGGRFAAFDSMSAGIAAMQTQLVKYVVNGADTIRKIVNKYAPSADGNNTSAYIADLMRQTGDKADQRLGAGDLPALMKAIINHENGAGYVKDGDITAGLQYGARQRAMASSSISHRSSSSEVHIGHLTVQTRATDAGGIARDLPRQLAANSIIGSIDTGVE